MMLRIRSGVKSGRVFVFPNKSRTFANMEKFKAGLPYLITGLLAGFMAGLAMQSIFKIL